MTVRQAEVAEIVEFWPSAFAADNPRESLKRIAIYFVTVRGVKNVSEINSVFNIPGIGQEFSSIPPHESYSIIDSVVKSTQYQQMQYPIFLLVGEVRSRLEGDSFQAANQHIWDVELAMVLKRILTRILQDLSERESTTLAHNYFLTTRQAMTKGGSSGFPIEFQKFTGRKLNTEKLRQILNKLESLGFISRDNYTTRPQSSSHRFGSTTYRLGGRPPRIPLAWHRAAGLVAGDGTPQLALSSLRG